MARTKSIPAAGAEPSPDDVAAALDQYRDGDVWRLVERSTGRLICTMPTSLATLDPDDMMRCGHSFARDGHWMRNARICTACGAAARRVA